MHFKVAVIGRRWIYHTRKRAFYRRSGRGVRAAGEPASVRAVSASGPFFPSPVPSCSSSRLSPLSRTASLKGPICMVPISVTFQTETSWASCGSGTWGRSLWPGRVGTASWMGADVREEGCRWGERSTGVCCNHALHSRTLSAQRPPYSVVAVETLRSAACFNTKSDQGSRPSGPWRLTYCELGGNQRWCEDVAITCLIVCVSVYVRVRVLTHARHVR